MREALQSVNLFTGSMHWVSRVFSLLIVVSAVDVTATSVFMLSHQLQDTTQQVISDGSVCQGMDFTNSVTGTLTYNITVFFVNALFCAWFGIRAVKLEKAGLLICFLASATFQAARIAYFALGTGLNQYFPVDPTSLVLRVVLLGGAGLLALASSLLAPVYSKFGWLTYAKGVTQAQQLQKLTEHQRFDTAVKLDNFVSINALISSLFLIDQYTARVIGVVLTSISVLLLTFLKFMIRRKQSWFLYLTICVGALTPGFYIFVVVLLIGEGTDECYSQHLMSCLAPADAVGSCPWGSSACTWSQNVSVIDRSAISLHRYPPSSVATLLMSNSTSGDGFLVNNCGTACFAVESNHIWQSIRGCCREYGSCVVLQELRIHDRTLMIAIAIAAVLVRWTSLYLGYGRRQDMDLPSVQEMFHRAERNLAELKKAATELRLNKRSGDEFSRAPFES